MAINPIGNNEDTKMLLSVTGTQSELTGIASIFGGTLKAQLMIDNCKLYQAEITKIYEDSTDYIIDMEDKIEEINYNAQSSIEELQKQLEEEMAKFQDESLSDEEKEEIRGKILGLQSQITELQTGSKSQLESIYSDGKSKYSVSDALIEEADKYSDKTLNLGKDLANTHVSSGFFKKLFGTSSNQRKKVNAGKRAIEAGNDLKKEVTKAKPNVKNILSKKRKCIN